MVGHTGARLQQRDDVRRKVGDDVVRGARLAREAILGQGDRRVLAQCQADPHRRADRRSGEARPPVGLGGADLAVGDPLVPELDAGQQRVMRVDQPLVAAPVDRQRRPAPGRVGGGKVRVHVGAAERVDRLLGVGDQHQRRAGVGKREPHDLPLRRIGVLELVDEHDCVARSQLLGRRRAARAGERRLQAHHEIVIRHHGHRALAALVLGARGVREPPAHLRRLCLLRRRSSRPGSRSPPARSRPPRRARTPAAACRG